MRLRSGLLLLSVCLLPMACGGTAAEFGPPRTLPKDQRPTQWDVPARQRLDVREMRPATPPQPAPRYAGATPPGWEALPPQPAKFRDLVWRVAGEPATDCSFTAATGGGEDMNLSRWYGQFGQPMAPAAELPVAELAGKQGRLLELKGTFNSKAGQAMLLIFTSEGDRVTTLKFTGPEAVVLANRAPFLALAQSLQVVEGAPAAVPDAPVPPAAAHPVGAPVDAPFTATVPAGWVAKASNKALHHTFDGEGEVYVAQISGDLRQNLDIWRTEIGQGQPMTDSEWNALTRLPMLGGEGVLFDGRGDWQGMSGKQIAGARLLLLARAEGGALTFVKCVGKAAAVDGQFEAFRAFCASLRRAE